MRISHLTPSLAMTTSPHPEDAFRLARRGFHSAILATTDREDSSTSFAGVAEAFARAGLAVQVFTFDPDELSARTIRSFRRLTAAARGPTVLVADRQLECYQLWASSSSDKLTAGEIAEQACATGLDP